jgi:ABC-type Zn uptake system ZnuABC Zn-binding protein ZnuA
MKTKNLLVLTVILLLALAPACAPRQTPTAADSGLPSVLAVESFLADITQNVAGDRLKVETLMPLGVDPHAFEPSPRDIARIADSTLLVVNGAGFESWLQETLDNAGGQHTVIEAAAGLTARVPAAGEHVESEDEHTAGDPHFWLDPLQVVRYVENIRVGLTQADPAGEEIYARNAAAYTEKLRALDAEIAAAVAKIPPEKRLIVTNHESFGYYADRYGFKIIGTVIPSTSTGASPSARQMAGLIDTIRATGAGALFLETGSNTELAEQIAADTDIRLVTGLHTHSLTAADGPAPSYIELMRDNTRQIVAALQ